MLISQDPLDKAFQALADSTRRAMLDRLTQGPATVSELAGPFDATLAAIVQHVQVLEHSGLIVTQKQGRSRVCRLSAEGLGQVERWLGDRRALWQSRFDRLGQLLEAPADDPDHEGTP